MKAICRALLFFCLVTLSACGDGGRQSYLEFAGGGFVINYRTANHFYGFVVRQRKPLPDGAKLRVIFELPGNKEEIQEIAAVPGQLQYKFQTGDIDAIVRNHPYKATLLVIDGETGKEIDRLEKSFKADIDQSKLPTKPLVTGPGYEQAPPQ